MQYRALIIFVFMLFYSNQSIAENGLSINHCENCGVMLIGSAKIFPDAIKWTLDNRVDIQLTAAYGSGFTGQVNYLQEHSQSGWDFSDTSNVFLEKAGKGDAINLYYSPEYVGKKEYEALYYIYESNVPTIISKLVKGEGKVDLDAPSSAITLSVDGYTAGYGAIPCSDGTQECFEVFIPKNQSINFDVTPRINSDAVTALQLDAQNHQHAIVKLVTSRQNDCPLYSFIDSMGTPNNFQLSDYFQYLDGNGPNYTQQTCQQRSYSFLVSNNKSFKFVVTNKDNRDKDYTVDYIFYIGGHYDSKSINKWKDSRKIFRIHSTGTTGNVVVTPTNQKPTASFSIPTTANVNQPITLDASNSSDSDGSINSYEWSSSASAQANFVSTINKTTSVSFSQAGNYTISLKVIDNKGDVGTLSKSITISDTNTTPQQATLTVAVSGTGGTVRSSDSVINCPSACSATYNKNATTTLTPIATTGYKFESWSTDCAAGTTDDIITVTVDQNKTCLVTFVQKIITPVVDKACFTMEYIDDRINFATDEIRKVKLDASCSGSNSQYKWRLYSDSNSNSKIFTTQEPITNLHDQFTSKVLPDGNYIATLIVGEGESQDQISQSLTIPPVLAKFNISLDSRKIILDASPSSKSKDSGTISYQWWTEYLGKLAPNTPGITMNNNIPSYLTIDYSNIPAALDNYETITLAITDSKGRVSTISQKAKVNLPAQVKIDDFSFVGNPTTNTDGTISVTLRGQATDPDGGVVTYKFVDSYCEPNNCLKPQVSIVTNSEGKEWQQATFNYANQKPIADAYLLQVTDNEVGNDQTTASKILRLDLPKLTSATINNKGKFGNTSTIFHGGVSIDGGKTYQTPVVVKSTQQLAIRGYFEVDSLDINQLADILLIVGTEAQLPFDGGADTTYVSFGATGFNFIDLYQSPDVWMAQLTDPFVKAVTLAKEMPLAQNLNLQLFTGTPAFFQWQSNTQWYFFLGYRLLDSKSEGKIVYSSQPITLKIEP